jgi:RNA polymerase sigma-70 factor (sigma-E family)
MTAREPEDPSARHLSVTETLVAGTTSGSVSAVARARVERDERDDARAACPAATAEALITLYSAHYRSLVRLSVLLLNDVATAEEVVQDSFVALHVGMHRLRDNDKALAYLRSAVVNRSRSVLRHRVVVERNPAKPAPDGPSAEHGALELLERSAVVAALRELPVRQREVVVLRYYADLSEAQIAEIMGITRGAVKSHSSRAMAALRAVLEPGSSAGAKK